MTHAEAGAYGTVMTGRLLPDADIAALQAATAEWAARAVPGFAGKRVLVSDDRRCVAVAVWCTSREAYWRLARDPTQDQWYREHLAPVLDGEPTWTDGEWVVAVP